MDHSPDTERRIVSRVLFAALALIVVISFAMLLGVIRMAHRRAAIVEAANHLRSCYVVASYQPFVYSPPPSGDVSRTGFTRQIVKGFHTGPPRRVYNVRGERPFWAGWVAAIFDNHPFAEIHDVMINDERFGDADVSILLQIPSLCTLDLSMTRITDEGVAFLAKNSKLAKLDFSSTQISNRSLETLDKLPELRELDVYDTNVTKEALEEFRKRHPDCLVFD